MKNILYEIANIIPDYITKDGEFYAGFSEKILEKILNEIFKEEFGLDEIEPEYYFTAIYDADNKMACDTEIEELRKELEKIEGKKRRNFVYISLTMIDNRTGNTLRFYFIPKLRVEKKRYKLPICILHRRIFYYNERRGIFGILDKDEKVDSVLEKYTNKEVVEKRIKLYINSIERYDKELYL